MAWSTWRDRARSPSTRTSPEAGEAGHRLGITLNLLNPKLTIFFFAFLPQFVRGAPHSVWRMLALSSVFMAMTFVVFAFYGLLAAVARERVLRRPQVLTGCAGPSRVVPVLSGRLALPTWVTSPPCSTTGTRPTPRTTGTPSDSSAATPLPTYAGSCWRSTR